MSKTSDAIPRVRDIDELFEIAHALERESATRYRELSTQMADQGEDAMAAQFGALAEMEDKHTDIVAGRSRTLTGHDPRARRYSWDAPPDFDSEARSAAISPYRALGFAVRNEERAFAFYAYVAAEAESPDIRALAEELAHDELQHAAILRRYRRIAFHRDRPVPFKMPESTEELLSMARSRDGEAAAAHMQLADNLDEIGETEDASIFRRLALQEEVTAAGVVVPVTRRLRSVADGLRLLEDSFDQYAAIGDRAGDEALVAEAQRLAGEAIARLALAGGARNNTLLDIRK